MTLNFFLSLTLQIVNVSIREIFGDIDNAFKNPDAADQETQGALRRLIKMYDEDKSITDELEREWETESHFNSFLAENVLVPLTDGKCIVNSDRTKKLSDNINIQLPSSLNLRGMAMGM